MPSLILRSTHQPVAEYVIDVNLQLVAWIPRWGLARDVIRRLVSRASTAPFQYALSTRVGCESAARAEFDDRDSYVDERHQRS